MKLTIGQRIERTSIFEPNSGCLIWLGSTFPNGYGKIHGRIDPEEPCKQRLVHRVIWQINNGYIPEGMFVCHRCDVRCCVNIDHLFLGTPKENMEDMIRKGRDVKSIQLKGTANPMSRLDDADVEMIINSPLGCRKLGVILGVSKTTIQRKRRQWQSRK